MGRQEDRRHELRPQPLGPSVDPSWVDAIPPEDFDSAGRLLLQANRDAVDSGRSPLEQQRARSVRLDLLARFPGLDEHVATATADELGIVGDRSLRSTHTSTRDRTGLTRADRHRHGDGRRSPPRDDPEVRMAMLLATPLIWLWVLITAPIWLWREFRQARPPDADDNDTDTEEIPF
jgi:hypothetical protein